MTPRSLTHFTVLSLLSNEYMRRERSRLCVTRSTSHLSELLPRILTGLDQKEGKQNAVWLLALEDGFRRIMKNAVRFMLDN